MFTELNKKQVSVIEPFFQDPGLEASVRDLSRRSDASPRWVSKIVSELEEKNILKVEDSNTSKRITSGDRFTEVKEIYNLDVLNNSELPEYLEKELRPDAIVLFGSYSRGEDTQDSDIDIAVIKGRKKDLDLENFEKELGREINIQKLESADKGDENFRNSLANGTVLRGFLKVV